MIATAVSDQHQTTLPSEICDALNLLPGDQVGWRVQDGEIRGRKLVAEPVDVLELDDLDPVTLAPKTGKFTREGILEAVRAEREKQ